MTGAGSGVKRDPKMVAFQQVLDRLNELFGYEDFTESQKVSFLEALLRTLLDDDALVQQAKVNTAKQFVRVPRLRRRRHRRRRRQPGRARENEPTTSSPTRPAASRLVSDIAKWFYEVATSELPDAI